MASKIPIPSLSTLSTVLDSVEMVKKAWSSFNLPTQFAPTMDVEELDKRIADLKAVEQWLNVNLSMLRGTIQGMEIQRGTLAAVKAFGKAVAPGMMGGAAAESRAAPAPAAPSPTAFAPMPAPIHAPIPAPEPVAIAPAAAPTGAASGTGVESAAFDTAGAAGESANLLANPAGWWNLLQTQFNQVAQAAMAGAGLATSLGSSAKSAVKSAARKAAGSGAAKGTAAGAAAGARSGSRAGTGSGRKPANAKAPAKAGSKSRTARKRAGAARKPPDLAND